MCVCMCVCMYICMYVCMLYLCFYLWMYVSVCVVVWLYKYVYGLYLCCKYVGILYGWVSTRRSSYLWGSLDELPFVLFCCLLFPRGRLVATQFTPPPLPPPIQLWVTIGTSSEFHSKVKLLKWFWKLKKYQDCLNKQANRARMLLVPVKPQGKPWSRD